MLMLPGKALLSLCARKLRIASDLMELPFGFATIVSAILAKKRSLPATR